MNRLETAEVYRIERDKTHLNAAIEEGVELSDVTRLEPPLLGYGREINKIYEVLFKSYLPVV